MRLRSYAGRMLRFATLLSTLLPVLATADEFKNLVSLGDVNGNNATDIGVLLRYADIGTNELSVLDGSNGNEITKVSYGPEEYKASGTVADSTGDMVPEFGVVQEGSLFALIKDVVNDTEVGRPKFNATYTPIAFLSLGEAGGSVGPEVAMVGLNEETDKVFAFVKEAASGDVVKFVSFSKVFAPFAAVAVDNVGEGAAKEIAVLGINVDGKVQAQVKDAGSGKLVAKIRFSRLFTPLFFAAAPDANGDLTNLAVLGRNADGVIQAQIKRVSDGQKIANIKFSKAYVPVAFLVFADSNASGSGEVGVVGVNATGAVRAQVKEIADGTNVNKMNFSRKYPPLDAIGINGAAGTGLNEIAVIGQNQDGEYRLQIKDLLSGNQVRVIPIGNSGPPNEDDDPPPEPPPYGY